MIHLSEYERKQAHRQVSEAMAYLRELAEGDENAEEHRLADGLASVLLSLQDKP